MNRRQILQLGGGVVALGAVGAGAWSLTRHEPVPEADAETTGAPATPTVSADDPLAVQPGERILGDPEAPATLIDYSSMTCPHCAQFHTETLPKIKENWIDAGRARLVFRHFPLDKLALAASMSAECLENDRAYFAYLDTLFARQAQWARAEDPLAELKRMAGLAGLPPERFDECVRDQELANKIVASAKVASEELEVSSTPSFFVNGEKISGAQDYEVFDAALSEAEGAA